MKIIRALYLNNRLFLAIGVVVIAFITCFIVDAPVLIPKILFLVLLAIVFTDIVLLFRVRRGVQGYRYTPEKLSNGDENEIRIHIENFYPFRASLNIIDEIPHQFQRRDLNFRLKIASGEKKIIRYHLRPVKRGEYSFGSVNIFVTTPVGFLSRRFKFSADALVPVYPSFIQMRKYELMAISNKLIEAGIKKIRRIGHNQEFELIKEYVSGDDIRTINWKATARRSHLMVNHFQDERSQQVYCLIDKGRVMQMPFNGMSLLDYAINASLVISNIAIKKSDKAGLITFQDKIGVMLQARKQNNQVAQILEVLYNQKTAYRESDFSALHHQIRKKISQRSLLLLFTNFESIYGLHRQLPYLKNLATQHLLVVIFFENTEMKSMLNNPARDLHGIYNKAVAEKFSYDKKLIVKELTRHGIQAMLTAPEHLTINTINKYLELKARGMV
ncbi:DUF58 domain-containing protein [Ohtaekwangia koreensis]|uniref:Uncharacterized conserved protein, DUF58 family, contains vWF domain n=1 Tax=Ohtaekwangia koreensis TaxID=688867 RepID=A0A1T5LB35_9BACT|nr:DUF58 domain-containing protein [Ohtaekwangia koreensis]SKC73163.1 Uncharacterized conserved protein, DUF58 family, contains vWF domain [Ohtaekwangia koreensis]